MRRSGTNGNRQDSRGDSQISNTLGISTENPFGIVMNGSQHRNINNRHLYSLDQESDMGNKLGHVIGEQNTHNFD